MITGILEASKKILKYKVETIFHVRWSNVMTYNCYCTRPSMRPPRRDPCVRFQSTTPHGAEAVVQNKYRADAGGELMLGKKHDGVFVHPMYTYVFDYTEAL